MAISLVVNEKLSSNDANHKADASLCKSLIRNLLSLSATRPDIMFVASLLSRFMYSPSKAHYGATKRVLGYVRGTYDYGLCFLKNESEKLQGYLNNDWARSLDNSKNTFDYVFSFGSVVFSWNSKK